MRILFASGKGGAGKTTVTAGLAAVWPRPFVLADADVEAPDLSIFLEHDFKDKRTVSLDVPVSVNDAHCNLCENCVDLCQFNAIIRLGKRIVPFSNMCHACGGCDEICYRGAIVMGKREIGTVSSGSVLDDALYYEGRSRVGEAMTPPLIRDMLKEAQASAKRLSHDLLIDSPPGVSCPVTTAARFADAVVLVADPTPFGFHDFKLALRGLSSKPVKIAVIVNRSGQKESEKAEEELLAFCQEKNLPVVAKLPFEREAATACAQGRHPVYAIAGWRERFEEAARSLIETLETESAHG